MGQFTDGQSSGSHDSRLFTGGFPAMVGLTKLDAKFNPWRYQRSTNELAMLSSKPSWAMERMEMIEMGWVTCFEMVMTLKQSQVKMNLSPPLYELRYRWQKPFILGLLHPPGYIYIYIYILGRTARQKHSKTSRGQTTLAESGWFSRTLAMDSHGRFWYARVRGIHDSSPVQSRTWSPNFLCRSLVIKCDKEEENSWRHKNSWPKKPGSKKLPTFGFERTCDMRNGNFPSIFW